VRNKQAAAITFEDSSVYISDELYEQRQKALVSLLISHIKNKEGGENNDEKRDTGID
jgi:hypothetical protein